MATPTTLNLVTDFIAYIPKVEAFIAGQPVAIPVPAETFEVEGITVSIAATTVTITK